MFNEEEINMAHLKGKEGALFSGSKKGKAHIVGLETRR